PLPTGPQTWQIGVVRVGGDAINVNGGSVVANGNFSVAPGTITRSDATTWGAAGFAPGQQVTLARGLPDYTVSVAPNATRDTITRASGSWLAEGFVAGQTITVAGAGGNNGTYTIAPGGVTATTLKLTVSNTVNVEGPETKSISAIGGQFIVSGISDDGKS